MFWNGRRFLQTLILLALSGGAFAQQPAASPDADLPQLYAQGMAAFQAADYPRAATALEGLIAKAEFSPQLEPVFFTLASAYFNAADYKKAIAALKNYQAKFPAGAHSGEVMFALAQSHLLLKNFGEAATQFAALEKDPRFHDQALLSGATAYKEGGKLDQAIVTLEKLAGTELKSAVSLRGAMMLAQLYSQKGASDKAISTIGRLREHIGLVDNIVELNAMTVELGDQMFGKKFYEDALACYRAAYPREQIVLMQNKRIVAMQQALDEATNIARTDPSQLSQLSASIAQLRADIARTRGLLAELEKGPNFTPAIYMRMARCFYETDRKWEAAVVYRELLERYPSAKEREPSLFGIIVSLADINQLEKAQARCEEYLRDFKTGPNAETVGYLLGAVALQANDPRAAETYFGRMLETQPKSQFREQMRYLLGNAKFMAGKHDEAAAEYKRYLSEYPKGQNVEDVTYRIALTALFSGKYEDAMNQLKSYMQKYPHGSYLSDAKYRLAVCKYAASLYDEVIADCKAWEAEFPKNKQLGETLALLADSYAATNREEQAIPIYIRSYQAAGTDEVMNYSLFAASKLLQKRGEWEKVGSLFTDFLRDKPDHPTAITALYWIGKAKAHEGKADEAKKITADTIKKYIGDPQRDAVELLLTQLAQLCVKKKRADDPAAATQPADPGAELDRLLGESEKEASPTAKARVLFAKAELARLRRQPAEEEKNIGAIAAVAKPEDLSALLLGRVGDYLLSKKQLDQAATFYGRLMDEYPKSDNVDFAYAGLGEIAFQKGDTAKALRYFTEGTDKIAASQKLKDVTVGKAKALLAMDRLDDARKVFEQVAAVREWRGETTAFSVYSLGEIEAKRGRWAEANAYFQRVYVGYQKFLPWVAKAYMRSAESLEKLGKQQEAANTYREMLRNERLSTFAEAEEARKRLQAMGQQG